jgi:hypothetical protein
VVGFQLQGAMQGPQRGEVLPGVHQGPCLGDVQVWILSRTRTEGSQT